MAKNYIWGRCYFSHEIKFLLCYKNCKCEYKTETTWSVCSQVSDSLAHTSLKAFMIQIYASPITGENYMKFCDLAKVKTTSIKRECLGLIYGQVCPRVTGIKWGRQIWVDIVINYSWSIYTIY